MAAVHVGRRRRLRQPARKLSKMNTTNETRHASILRTPRRRHRRANEKTAVFQPVHGFITPLYGKGTSAAFFVYIQGAVRRCPRCHGNQPTFDSGRLSHLRMTQLHNYVHKWQLFRGNHDRTLVVHENRSRFVHA